MHYILTGIYEIYIGSIAPVLLHQCYKIYQKDILIYTLLFANFNLGVLNNFSFIILLKKNANLLSYVQHWQNFLRVII